MVKLLSFKFVYLRIPRKKILKNLDKHSINIKDHYKYSKLHTKTEQAIYKLQHLSSILERLMLKNTVIKKRKET